MDYIFIIILLVFVVAIAFTITHQKNNQSDIMDYYKKTSAEGSTALEESLKNQKRMITLLEDISKKLENK